MRALDELARARPEWADALWRQGLTREYRTVLDDEVSVRVDAGDAERMEREYEARFESTAQRALLAAWIETAYQDSPDWPSSVFFATEFAGPQRLRWLSGQLSGHRDLRRRERAIADVLLRKIAVPDQPNPAGEPPDAITAGGRGLVRIPVRLEAFGGELRVAPPVGYPDITDLIAEYCAGWSDNDRDQLLRRIQDASPELLRSSRRAAQPATPAVYGRSVDPEQRPRDGGPENVGRVDEFATREHLVEHLGQLDPDATLRVRERHFDGDHHYSVRLRNGGAVVVDPETDGNQEYSTAMPSELLTIEGFAADGQGRPLRPTEGYVEWVRARRDELALSLGLDTEDWSDDALAARRAQADSQWADVESVIPTDHVAADRAAALAALYQEQARIAREIEHLDELAALAADHRIAVARYADAADRDESRRHLADEVAVMGGVILTDNVALVLGATDEVTRRLDLEDYPELLVIAPQRADADSTASKAAGDRPHLIDALRELARRYPEYRDVLWSGRVIRYQEGIPGQSGWTDLRPLDADLAADMLGDIQQRYLDAAREALLTEHLRREAAGEGGPSWLYIPLDKILTGIRRRDGNSVFETASATLTDEIKWAREMARLVYDIMTGPVPQSRRYTGTAHPHTVGVPFFGSVPILVEQRGTRWWLAQDGSPLAEHFGELSARSEWRLPELLYAALVGKPKALRPIEDTRDWMSRRRLRRLNSAAPQLPADDRTPLGDVRSELAAVHRAAEDEQRTGLTDAADALDDAASRQVVDEIMQERPGGIRLAPGAVYFRAEDEVVLAARAGRHAQELDRLIKARPDLLNRQSPPRARLLAWTVTMNGRVAVAELPAHEHPQPPSDERAGSGPGEPESHKPVAVALGDLVRGDGDTRERSPGAAGAGAGDHRGGGGSRHGGAGDHSGGDAGDDGGAGPGDSDEPGVASERTRLMAEIVAIRDEIASLRSQSEGSETQAGMQDEAGLDSLRVRVQRVLSELQGMLARFDDTMGRLGDAAPEEMRFHRDPESQWLTARGMDVLSLWHGVESLSDNRVSIDDPDLRAFWNVIQELTGVRGATDPEDPNYVQINGLSALQAALANAAPGQHPILTDTAERIVGAVRTVLAHDPTLPLSMISFSDLDHSAVAGTSTVARTPALGLPVPGYEGFPLNAFGVIFNVRNVLQPERLDYEFARSQETRLIETGTGDARTDILLHEIYGHGSQIASGCRVVDHIGRGPFTWAERHIDEHRDAAFETLTAAGEIPPDRGAWEGRLSKFSYDPADPSQLNKHEALSESAVYVLGNPGSDWRTEQYALYRALRGMSLLDSAEVQRFQAAEQLGIPKPHLLDPSELAAAVERASHHGDDGSGSTESDNREFGRSHGPATPDDAVRRASCGEENADAQGSHVESQTSGDPTPEADTHPGLPDVFGADLLGYDEVRRIASLSERLRDDWVGLKSIGWRVVGRPGEGSYCDYDSTVINIDPEETKGAAATGVAGTLIHEVGHAIHRVAVDASSREAYIQSMLDGEGAAVLYSLDRRREVLANGGPDIDLFHGVPKKLVTNIMRAYDAYHQTGTLGAYKEAIRAIGKEVGASRTSAHRGTTYRDFHGRNYDQHFGSGPPDDPDPPHLRSYGPAPTPDGTGRGGDDGPHGRAGDDSADGAGDGGAGSGEGGDGLPDFADVPGWNEVRRIASMSETLMEQWQHVRAAGWHFEFSNEGGHAEYHARVINIAPKYCENPKVAVHSMAHKFGHVLHGEPEPDTSSRDAFIQSLCSYEGMAIMNEFKARREILASGGPDIHENWHIARKDGSYFPVANFGAVYDAYFAAGPTPKIYQKACEIIGNIIIEEEVRRSGEGNSYADYYGHIYDKYLSSKWRRLVSPKLRF